MLALSRIAFVAASALLFSACATTSNQGQPSWVEGASDQYPRTSYLTGIGQGSELENAKNRARADIAKIFKLQVSSRSSDETSASFGSASKAAEVSSKLSRHIETSSNQVISGIEIADHWQNPTTRDHHALAVLPRHKARNSLTQDIRSFDDATAEYLAQVESESDALRRVGYQILAIEAQQQRTERQEALRIVDLSGRGIEARWPIANLRNQLAALQQQATIAVYADDDALATSLAGAMATNGFVQGADAAYELSGNMRTADLGKRDGWFWLRASIDIELSDAQGNTLGKDQWQVKASAQTQREAKKRLQDKVNKTLEQELGKALLRIAVP